MSEEATLDHIKAPHLTQHEVIYMGETFTSHEVEVRPTNELTFVVPVYREFANGNVPKLVKGLLDQSLSPEKHECIFLVNNTQKAREETAEAFTDNQNTIQFLRAIQDSTMPTSSFSEEEQEIISSARENELKVNYVDMASEGISEVNIGALRNLGFKIAKRRSEKTVSKIKGIVMNFDADTTFLSNTTTESVVAEFTNENTQAVVLGIDWVAEEPDNPDYVENMQRAVMNTEEMQMQFMLRDQEITWGSPQLALRIGTLIDLGGIPELTKGEDFELCKRVISQFKDSDSISVRPDHVALTTFRAREDNPDGFDSKEIHGKFHTDTEFDPFKNLYDTIWDKWFSGKVEQYKKDGVPAAEAAERISTYIKSLIEEDQITDDFDVLERLDNYDEIHNWVYDMTTNENSLFPARTGPQFVSYAVGFILYNNISENEYAYLSEIIEQYAETESELIGHENETLGDIDEEYLDVGKQLPETTFRFSKVLLRAINIFLQEAIVTNNLPDTKNVIELLTRSNNIYNDNA